MSRVEVTDLFKSYQLAGRELEVLRGISFTLEDYSFVTLVGKSGCGKTTLLRIVCGLETASRGGVHFIHDSGNENSRKASIVFQEPRLMPWLTVGQNMAFALAGDPDKKRTRETVDFYLNLLGLTDFRNAYPSQISGGMAQRVSLGRTLCLDSDVILMDEPFGALDAFTRRNLQKELVNIFTVQRKTILFVTHDVDEAIYMGQRVLVMERGQITEDIRIDLPYPRDPLSKEFYPLRERILSSFFDFNDTL
jgi:sulfonate transport system ATP-binding protein